MSSDKNKKKKTNKMNLNTIFLSVIGVIMVVAVIFIIASSVNKKIYYNCTQYDMVYSDHTDNILKSYEYYHLYFNNDDHTFTLKYKLNDVDKEYVEKGTFVVVTKTINGDEKKVMTLTYEDYADEITGNPEYILQGESTWVRNQTTTLGVETYNVKQTFEKK